MQVDFYTPEFGYLHTENKLTSVQWDLKYADSGTLELHTDSKSDLIPYLLPANHSDVIAVQGSNAAWIHGLTDIRNKYDFEVYGKTLNCMLKWRMLNPFTAADGQSVETVIRAKVAEQFTISGSEKYLPSFALAPVIGETPTFGTSLTYSFESMQKPLFDVVKELCALGDLGFHIKFDLENQKYVFELYRGVDRSADQSAVPPLYFSEPLKNFDNPTIYIKQDGYASCGYYKVTDEETNEITYTEAVKDSRSGFYRREAPLDAESADEAKAELADSKKVEQINGAPLNVKYGVDYGLGDIVTVQKRVGGTLIVQNKRIIEVKQVFEPLKTSETAVLDEDIMEEE